MGNQFIIRTQNKLLRALVQNPVKVYKENLSKKRTL